jgi:hypothetical protein
MDFGFVFNRMVALFSVEFWCWFQTCTQWNFDFVFSGFLALFSVVFALAFSEIVALFAVEF